MVLHDKLSNFFITLASRKNRLCEDKSHHMMALIFVWFLINSSLECSKTISKMSEKYTSFYLKFMEYIS